MTSKILLALTQLPGISRSTIHNSIELTPRIECISGTDCTPKIISILLEKAMLVDKRIRAYSQEEIAIAIHRAEEIIEASEQAGIGMVTYLDEAFPRRLRDIKDPPVILYYKGDIASLNEKPTVAIVGTRKPTVYGMKMARKMGEAFAGEDYVVVSGLATGCDTSGHVGCLDGNGKTVAVMPQGLDTIYPKSNQELAEQIVAAGGALISEYPIYSELQKRQFVERDRLESGLSDGVLVVETGETGGTWHTIQYALENGRPLACCAPFGKCDIGREAAGNRKLLNMNNTIIEIVTEEDLHRFRREMEEHHRECQTTEKGHSPENPAMTQRTIYDYLQ